jgi:hypothetical protein
MRTSPPGSAIDPKRTVHEPTPRASRALGVFARLAAAWMLGFAVLHGYWLAGGRIGLPNRDSIYQRPALVVIDVIAIPLGLAGYLLTRSLYTADQRRPPPRVRLWPVAATATVLLLPTRPARAGNAAISAPSHADPAQLGQTNPAPYDNHPETTTHTDAVLGGVCDAPPCGPVFTFGAPHVATTALRCYR